MEYVEPMLEVVSVGEDFVVTSNDGDNGGHYVPGGKNADQIE